MKSSDFLSKLSLFKYSFTFVFFLIVIFSVFFIKIYNTTDPDFGWHLRTGEIIIKEGIPKTDPFSYTMPNFPYVDHAWLTDVFIVVIYSSFGKLGLTIVFSLLMF